MSDEVCPNCEAPFSDLQMMGVGGNQASPRFQCGSIFVPVANRLVVKTYACMKIAELRASIAKPAAVPEAVAKNAAQEIVSLIVRDLCETEPANPDDPDSVCVSVDELRETISRHILSAADTEVKNG